MNVDSTQPFEIIVIPSDHGVGLTVGPDPRFGGPGGQAVFAITATATQTIDAQAGFTGEVQLRVEGLPAGVTGGFTPATLSLTPGEEKVSSLTVSVGTGVPHGRYPFTVLADHGDPTKTATTTGELIVGNAPAPTPTPTPRPTPTPTPAPTPAPTSGPTNLVFSTVTAPVDSRTIDREGTFTFSEERRVLRVGLAQSDTIFRRIDLEIHSSNALQAGSTAQILASSSPRWAQFTFFQEGGTPYYQPYKAASFGAFRLEDAPGGKLRIVIEGSLHLLPDPLAGAEGITGSFNLSGTMLLNPG